jgi:hypothetical protein
MATRLVACYPVASCRPIRGALGWIMALSQLPGIFEHDLNSIDRIVELLEVQRHMTAAGTELSVLVQQHNAAPLEARPAIRAQFDELTAIILAYSEQIRALACAYHRRDES